MMKIKELEPVEVEWIDAQTWNGEAEKVEVIKELKPYLSKTCGYLLFEDKERIIISFLNFGEGRSKHFQMIPKGMVKKITKLKEVKNGKHKIHRAREIR